MSALRVFPPVADALAWSRPIVALESSVLAQGLPIPANREAATRMIGAVARAGALAAITAVVQGVCTLGVSDADAKYPPVMSGDFLLGRFKATRKLWGAEDKPVISNDDKLIERPME